MAIVRIAVIEGDHDEVVPLYQKVSEKIMSSGGQGPRVHIAMKTPKGIRVANLWASEAEADAAGQRLQKVFEELGVDDGRASFEQHEVINAVADGKPLSF